MIPHNSKSDLPLGSGGGSGTTGCAKIPSWMKWQMGRTSGLERIIQGKKAPKPIPWQAHMRSGKWLARLLAMPRVLGSIPTGSMIYH